MTELIATAAISLTVGVLLMEVKNFISLGKKIRCSDVLRPVVDDIARKSESAEKCYDEYHSEKNEYKRIADIVSAQQLKSAEHTEKIIGLLAQINTGIDRLYENNKS